jgi:membrane-associated protease RseP (regulator of RpoE activity)
MTGRWLLVALLLAFPTLAYADEPKKEPAKKEAKVEAKSGLVPYRLTDTHHTLVRVKINGKGPFNFIVDTGCPVFLIAEPVGEKIGLKPEKGWATLDKLELEGGLELTKVKARVETPFQIEGMNSMGLAGVELHGLMGYTVLAKYKLNFDYTKKQMAWTPLAFEPPPPMPLGKGAKAATGGMDTMVTIIRLLTFFAGIGPAPPPQPRGFFGFELDEKDDAVFVAGVLPGSPAAQAGLKKGDRILSAAGKEIRAANDVVQQASKLTAGKTLNLAIERNKEKQELKITAGEGL